MAKYTNSKRPIIKTGSQEAIERFKTNKLKNLLQTGINTRLIDGVQSTISANPSAKHLTISQPISEETGENRPSSRKMFTDGNEEEKVPRGTNMSSDKHIEEEKTAGLTG